MDILQAIILGVVEGITEFLPISSTGHLMLAAKQLGLLQTEFIKSFEIAIQLGAILAVVVLYWKTLVHNLDVWKRVIVAFVPTAIIGLIFYKIVKHFFLSNNGVVLWSLFLGGVVLIIFEIFYREKDEPVHTIQAISYKQSFFIGLFQSIAIIPGVSRSAATIVGGLALGLKRRTIVEFSFFLAIPTMLAATALDMLKSAGGFNRQEFILLAVGFAVSFLVATVAIKSLLVFIKRHNFIVFGVYRILIAIIFWFLIK